MSKRKIIITIITIVVLLTLAYFVNRYLIPRVEMVVSKDTEAKIDTEFEATDNSYKSDEIEINIEKIEEGNGNDKITYFVADIKLQNPKRINRAFAKDQIGTNIVEGMIQICKKNNAILAINGDYYSFRNNGIIIGNSNIYRNSPKREALAIYNDGTMKIYNELDTSAEELIQEGVKDTLSFGPVLVREHKIDADYTEFSVDEDNIIRNNIAVENPRTGIGYYKKNHYCFVVVDGRNPGYSKGVTLNKFAEIFENLGCEFAYNLDGGNSSNMYFLDKKINKSSQPGDGEREISDILCIN